MILLPQNRCVRTSQRQGVAIKHRTGTGGLDFIRQCLKISRAARSFWGSRHSSSGLALAFTQHPFPENLRQLHCTVGVKFPFSVSKEVHLMVLLALCLATSHSQESATLPGVRAATGKGWLSLHPILPFARCGVQSSTPHTT